MFIAGSTQFHYPRSFMKKFLCPGLLLAWLHSALWTDVSAQSIPTRAPAIVQLNAMKHWQTDAGDWLTSQSVSANPDEPARLIPGSRVDEENRDLILINGHTGRTVNLHSRIEHGDAIVHVEFLVPQGSNSGVYLQGRYEIQILDSYGKSSVSSGDCGGIYERWKENHGFEGFAPKFNASRPAGTWQSFDAVFRAPRFSPNGEKVAPARFESILHNGIAIHENVEVSGPTRAATFEDEKPRGPLMLQGDHGPVAYRNIWIVPLD